MPIPTKRAEPLHGAWGAPPPIPFDGHLVPAQSPLWQTYRKGALMTSLRTEKPGF
jgi:hypothetical protein